MTNTFVRHISKYSQPLWDLVLSVIGGFAFIGRLGTLAKGEDGFGTGFSPGVDVTPRKPLPGLGAALFLLAFVASEALATIGAFRH
jgi:hypothetical protein